MLGPPLRSFRATVSSTLCLMVSSTVGTTLGATLGTTLGSTLGKATNSPPLGAAAMDQ